MGWTYLEPTTTRIAGSPAPTPSDFYVRPGTGTVLVVGPCTVDGTVARITEISTDHVSFAWNLDSAPPVGADVVQNVVRSKDKVRLLCGDTDSTDPQLQDAEIDAFLLDFPNAYRAAAQCCRSIAANLARKADYQIYQEIQERMSAVSKAYMVQAKEYDKKATLLSAIPYAGGLLQVEKDTAVQDRSMVKPFFTREMMTEPGTEPGDDISNVGFVQPVF